MGRLTPGTFFVTRHKVFDGRAYNQLSSHAKAAYYVFKRLYDGHNNGGLLMSARMMAERLHISYPTASRTIIELINADLIEVTCRDEYGFKPKARAYRLMEYKCDVTGMPAREASSVQKRGRVR